MSALDEPVTMLSEWEVGKMVANRTGRDPLLASLVLDYLTEGGRQAGFQLKRTYRRRWNTAGEQIGPECLMAASQVRHVERAMELVSAALDQGVKEMLRAPG